MPLPPAPSSFTINHWGDLFPFGYQSIAHSRRDGRQEERDTDRKLEALRSGVDRLADNGSHRLRGINYHTGVGEIGTETTSPNILPTLRNKGSLVCARILETNKQQIGLGFVYDP